MTSDNTYHWRTVTRANPCPVCGKGGWCRVTEEGNMCRCMRQDNGYETKGGGWLYVCDDGQSWHAPAPGSGGDRERIFAPVRVVPSVLLAMRSLHLSSETIRAEIKADADVFWCLDLACYVLGDHGLPVGLDAALQSLGVYLSMKYQRQGVLAFPMRSEDGTIVGVRYRSSAGKKWSLKGGRDGLFFSPRTVHTKAKAHALYICEGATDTLALTTIGLPTVGRSSCGTGKDAITALCRKVRPSHLVIIADNDRTHFTSNGTPYMPGRSGAINLARAVGIPCSIIFLSGVKDVLDFVAKSFADGIQPAEVAKRIERLARDTPPRMFK